MPDDAEITQHDGPRLPKRLLRVGADLRARGSHGAGGPRVGPSPQPLGGALRLRAVARGGAAAALVAPRLLHRRPPRRRALPRVAARPSLHRELHLHAVHQRVPRDDLAAGPDPAPPRGPGSPLRVVLGGSRPRQLAGAGRVCPQLERGGDPLVAGGDRRAAAPRAARCVSRHRGADRRSRQPDRAQQRVLPGGRRGPGAGGLCQRGSPGDRPPRGGRGAPGRRRAGWRRRAPGRHHCLPRLRRLPRSLAHRPAAARPARGAAHPRRREPHDDRRRLSEAGAARARPRDRGGLLPADAELPRDADRRRARCARPGAGGAQPGAAVAEPQPKIELVTDPVCHMRVRSDPSAPHISHEGHEVFFCSEMCKEQFLAAPERFPLEAQ